MPTAIGPDGWVYYKLYVGIAADRLDAFIVHVLTSVLAEMPCARWFFLRYVDERGLHVRLRTQLRPEARTSGPSALAAICRRSLAALPGLAITVHRPMVPVDAVPAFPRGTTGMVAARYEPEIDTFGGPAGMAIAEEAFETSSRVALDVLRNELEGRCSRKTLAPDLMATASRVLIPLRDRQEFWRRYSLHWLGGDTPVARHWQDRFTRKARSLRQGGASVIPVQVGLRPPAGSPSSLWRAQLERARRHYGRLPARGGIDALAFQFIHLMNNRLGLLALEEAYLATLIADTSAEWPVDR